ncbi:hypothetical protein SLEP1_g41660 [Rubroshorea leprosula]|uniref:Uncharacterized protein n=1 Tax=Rubroshorea leprosula TaxID=152421 RepID=A0AAV5L787_9ROSI|nr:hypothetical protein SLEP1_g41660 [Rubroshorea leprosula]
MQLFVFFYNNLGKQATTGDFHHLQNVLLFSFLCKMFVKP